MTYRYAMNGKQSAMLYREADDGSLVAEAEISSRLLQEGGDIEAIARATVAALNGTTTEPDFVCGKDRVGQWYYLNHGGTYQTCPPLDTTTTEPRVAWHPKAVEALRAVNDYWGQEFSVLDGGAKAKEKAWRRVIDALALVNQPPAEKVVGWVIKNENSDDLVYERIYSDIEHARYDAIGNAIFRLVEEPN